MKKILLCMFSVFFAVCSAFAGDVASFDDIGFSEDGKYYLFGQYGKTDKTYEPWAEIYTVDVAANDFVKGEIFKFKDSSLDISGREAYENLKEKCSWKISKYNSKPAGTGTLLYLRESETKAPTEEIVFQDFEGISDSSGIFYHVRLVPVFNGKGKNCRSKFFIEVLKKDSSGNTLSSISVGTPDFERPGITAYQIERIFTDKSGKSLVFVVKKTLEDDTGISIRYMVETCEVKGR
ncbi:DUF2259 domain-containing protein [Treponema sp.]|uniref:DUF2259 domain-containing protein n=1 Tax=Treponema sp. TaxID=166 RepID=UPI003F0F9112